MTPRKILKPSTQVTPLPKQATIIFQLFMIFFRPVGSRVGREGEGPPRVASGQADRVAHPERARRRGNGKKCCNTSFCLLPVLSSSRKATIKATNRVFVKSRAPLWSNVRDNLTNI